MPDLSQRCILAIGNTGNGKSFTATVFGAQNVRIGHSTESETNTVTIYNIEKGGFYIDTPGFDDSDEVNDNETLRSICLKMLEMNIQKITTILWFVVPDNKAKASYKRQARFIESLAKYYTDGNVWDNTIIVNKGGKGDTIDNGPGDAARKVAQKERKTDNDLLLKTKDFNILLFESLLPTSVYVKKNMPSDELNEYGVYKGSEPERILSKYELLMEEHLKYPIHLNLRKVKCSKCPEETDPRFASSKCHKMESFHPNIESVHRGKVIDIHTSPHSLYKHSDYYVKATTKQVFDDSPQAWTARVFTFGGVQPTRPELVPGYWKCCNNNDANSRGCKQVHSCCERDYQSSGCQEIYDVCRHERGDTPCLTICKNCKKELDKEGCKEKCSNCKNDDTRNKEGCIEVSHNFLE